MQGCCPSLLTLVTVRSLAPGGGVGASEAPAKAAAGLAAADAAGDMFCSSNITAGGGSSCRAFGGGSNAAAEGHSIKTHQDRDQDTPGPGRRDALHDSC